MKTKPTIRDVAKLANVSISTVSRVMNAPETVVESKREKVIAAIDQLQYQPNAFARGLIYKKSNTLGIFIPDIQNPYFSGVIRGVQDTANKLGYSIMICNTDQDEQRLLTYIRTFYEKQVDGLIFASDILRAAYYEEMQRFKLPIVLVSTHSENEEIPSVGINNEQASYDAVQHLIEYGHQNIGMIAFPNDDILSGLPRYNGFMRALQDAGLERNCHQVEFATYKFEEAYLATERLLDKYPNLSAVFAASDEFALGVIACLRSRGMHVPDDVSVIGFDNIRMSYMSHPKLTTIDQSDYQTGATAVHKMDELLKHGKSRTCREIMPHRLIVRESTRCIK